MFKGREILLGGLLAATWAGAQAPGRAEEQQVAFGPNINLTALAGTQAIEHAESSIAVNPGDPASLVAGFHDSLPTPGKRSCAFAFTADAGATWTRAGAVPLERGENSCFDPALAADLRGIFYYSYLDLNFDPSGGLFIRADIRVARSGDGGRSFPAFSVAVRGDEGLGPDSICPDKPYIAADTRAGSRFRGNLYLSFTNFSLTTDIVTQIRVLTSSDGGRSWSAPLGVSPSALFPASVQGSLPVVAPDGTVYVFYAEFSFFTTAPTNIRFVKSTNGGRSWSRPASVAAGLPSPGVFLLDNGSRSSSSSGSVGFRSNSLPAAAAAPDGTLYVAWADFPQGSCVFPEDFVFPVCTNSDVRLSVSRDGGKTWSAPVKASDETNATDQFLPWIAAHPGGLLSLFWLDRRLDPENADYDAFYTNTRDGRTFLPNVRITEASSITRDLFFLGDYNGLAVTEDAVFTVWGDRRSLPDLNIFAARGTLAAAQGSP